MYIEYTVGNTTTEAEVIADLAAVIAGETVLGNLSASAVSLVSVGTATWSIYDDDLAGGSGTIALRSALSDEAAAYKFCTLHSRAASQINVWSCEDWNATTHAGTNVVGDVDTSYHYFYQPDTAGACTYYIYTNAKCLYITQRDGTYSGLRVTGVGTKGGILIGEHTRDMPWQSVGAGYNPVFWMSTSLFGDTNASGYVGQFPITKDTANLEITKKPCHIWWVGGNGSQFTAYAPGGYIWNNGGLAGTVYNTTGVEVILYMPMWIGNSDYAAAPFGEWAKHCGLKFCPISITPDRSVVYDNSVPHLAVNFHATVSAILLLPKA